MTHQPYGYWRFGNECLEGYKIISAKHPGLHPLFSLKHYLLGRAIELYLKAYLLKTGVQDSVLKRKFGHDLEKLANEALSKGINSICRLGKKDQAVISLLNAYYKPKEFEYIVEGIKHLPRLEDLELLSQKLNDSIKISTAP